MANLIRDSLGLKFDFVGVNKSWEDLEALASDFYNDERAKRELDVTNKKWFEYRKAHPIRLTYFSIYNYLHERRAAYGRHVNSLGHAPKYYTSDFSLDFFKKKAYSIYLHLSARQLADEACIPYNFFWRYGFDTLIDDLNWKSWDRTKWPKPMQRMQMPTPTFFIKGEVVYGILFKWEEYNRNNLVFCNDLYYHNHNYHGSKIQDDHHRWLCEMAKMRKEPEHGLRRLVHEHEVLKLESVEKHFDTTMVRKVEKLS